MMYGGGCVSVDAASKSKTITVYFDAAENWRGTQLG